MGLKETSILCSYLEKKNVEVPLEVLLTATSSCPLQAAWLFKIEMSILVMSKFLLQKKQYMEKK